MAFTSPTKMGKETKLNKILQRDAIFLFPNRLLSPHLVGIRQERYLSIRYSSLYSQGSSAPSGSSCPHDFPPPTENLPSSTRDTSLSLPSPLNKYACQGLSS